MAVAREIGRLPGAARVLRVRTDLVELNAALEQRLAIVHVPRLRGESTLGFEGGGEDAYRALLCPQLIDEPHLMGRRHDVRRHHRELAASVVYGLGYRSKLQAADALVALGEPLALVGAVGHYLGAGPVERRAAGEHAGERLVRREALLIVLVGALRPLRHRHA